MSKSVKKNFVFNLVNSASQLLFPLITFPYASRIMMADGIGQINFFNSIISYISLFTCLGIPMYAIREVAKVRNDAFSMQCVVVEIFSLHILLTIGGYLAVMIICLTVPQVSSNIPLFLILSVGIFFSTIGCEWFYQGIEDFKYVAVRGLIFKILSIVFLFIFVKSREDILLYAVYTAIGSVGGNLLNLFRLRKYIHLRQVAISQLHPFRHFKLVLHVFAFNVVISIYLQLNVVLLGFFTNSESVGYFVAATKLLMITMSISSALGAVMMPRVTNLLSEGKKEEFKTLIQKSYDFIIALTLPLTVGLIFTSESAILLLSGDGFIPAINASRIVASNILMVGISGVLGIQILYPMGKINMVIFCTLIGAIVNMALNFLLIPHYGLLGTATAYLFAEIAVTLTMIIIGRNIIPIRYFKRQHLNYLYATVVMAFVLYGVSCLQLGNVFTILLMLTLGVSVYFFVLLTLRDYWGLTCLNLAKYKIEHYINIK